MKQVQPVFAATLRRSDLHVRAERIRPALQPRVLGLSGSASGSGQASAQGSGQTQSWRVLHLERGEARLRDGETEVPIQAPVLGCIPWEAGMRLELGAGVQGTHLVLGGGTLERALLHRSEAAQLRLLTRRPLFLALSQATSAPISACITGLLEESLRPGPMASGMIDSLLHVLLIQLMRGQPETTLAAETGGGQALAARFVTLVEQNFRARWTVSDYASALGISRDRLSDICMRAYGQPPGALLRARLHQEARLCLETAPLSLDQIAGLLGFAGTAQFARFFKSLEGVPPGRYRATLRQDGPAADAPPPYAWP